MPHVTQSIVIARPRHVVWDYVVDVANTPRWNPMFVHQELVGTDELTAGVTIRSVASVVGRRIVSDSTVTELDRPHRSTLTGDSPFEYTGNYLLETVPGGTVLTWHMEAAAGLGGVFGVLADGVVIALVRLQLQVSLRRLRRQLESAPAEASAVA